MLSEHFGDPTSGIKALVNSFINFLVCSVVAVLTDLPHQKRFYCYCQVLSILYVRVLFICTGHYSLVFVPVICMCTIHVYEYYSYVRGTIHSYLYGHYSRVWVLFTCTGYYSYVRVLFTAEFFFGSMFWLLRFDPNRGENKQDVQP